MNPQPDPRWEERVQTVARSFAYPPTPDIADAVQSRLLVQAGAIVRGPGLRPVWVTLIALALLLAGLFATPPIRAAILQWLQIGAVRIWLVEPTPTPAPPQVTAVATATRIPSLLNLDGETTLAKAQAQLHFPIRLPSYPADLGPPDKVFLQNLGDAAVILVWLDKIDPSQVRMSLHLIGPNSWAIHKIEPKVVDTTAVNGEAAAWTEGPYLLSKQSGDLAEMRLVEGHVLIWQEESVTYRLESELSLAEAVQVAQSLVAWPPAFLNFRGKTTLAQAQARLNFPIRLPTVPADSGAPDHIFLQETNGWFVVLVWMAPDDRQKVRLVLYEVGPGISLSKGQPPVLRTTRVHGRPAAWIEGIHYLEYKMSGWNQVRLIDQDVLVWSEIVDGQEITYRLETTLPEVQAISIAESLQ